MEGEGTEPVRFPIRATLAIVLVFALVAGGSFGWKPGLRTYWMHRLRAGDPVSPWRLASLGGECAGDLAMMLELGGPSSSWRLAAEALAGLESRGALEEGFVASLSPAARARYLVGAWAEGGAWGGPSYVVQGGIAAGGAFAVTTQVRSPPRPFAGLGDDAVEPLIEMLRDPDIQVAQGARRALAQVVEVDLDPSEWPAFWASHGAAPAEERKLRGWELQARRHETSWVLNNMAWTLVTADASRLHDPPRALELARRAVELSKGADANAIDTLAEALFRNGKADEALDQIARSIALEPHRRYFARQRERFLAAKRGEKVGPPAVDD